MRTALTSLALLFTLVAGAAHAQAPVLERTTGPRVRFGADLGAGGGTTGYRPAVALAAHVRAGVQIDDHFAVYYQAAGLTGDDLQLCIFSCPNTPPHGYGMLTNSAMFEATLENGLQLAIGPSVAVGMARAAFGGVGGSARVAYTLGGNGTGTRQGFSIGTQVDSIYVPDAGVVPTQVVLTLGWETF